MCAIRTVWLDPMLELVAVHMTLMTWVEINAYEQQDVCMAE